MPGSSVAFLFVGHVICHHSRPMLLYLCMLPWRRIIESGSTLVVEATAALGGRAVVRSLYSPSHGFAMRRVRFTFLAIASLSLISCNRAAPPDEDVQRTEGDMKSRNGSDNPVMTAIPDPKPPWAIDTSRPWSIEVGRGSGWNGLNAVKIDNDGTVVLHRLPDTKDNAICEKATINRHPTRCRRYWLPCRGTGY